MDVIASRNYKFAEFAVLFRSSVLDPLYNYLLRWLIITVMHRTQVVVELKSEEKSGLNGIRTQDLCNTGAALYQLSYQTNWEPATL